MRFSWIALTILSVALFAAFNRLNVAMDQVGQLRPEIPLTRFAYSTWTWAAPLLLIGSAALLILTIVTNIEHPKVIWILGVALATYMGAFALASTRFARHLRYEDATIKCALRATKDEVRQMTRSARIQEEALRRATVSLTEDRRMDELMGELLRYLEEIVPYTCARVIVPEGGPHWLALGERFLPEMPDRLPPEPWSLVDDKCPLIRRIAAEKKSILIPDTKLESDWATFDGHNEIGSWFSVPLIACGEYLGFLSVGHAEPKRLTEDHVRRAELLAIPAAVAIENARLYTRSEIFASELSKRCSELQAAEAALLRAEGSRAVSDDRFQKVFNSSPIPFSITTSAEGKFMDVNAAFERRFGYSREELLGRTVHELRMWQDPSDRTHMLALLQKNGSIRNVFTHLRAKSGEIKVAAYSASQIDFDGTACILAVSEDVLQYEPEKVN